ncbi:MAG: hypothetical protein K9L32_12795 [Chromatiaceae bacterium]|nr:hypothetical protein [Chromatiaceae bacterium]
MPDTPQPGLVCTHIKRNRRTKTQIAQLDQQILSVLRQDHPQSVRHVFYRMTDPRLLEPVEKSEKGYRTVQGRIVELRRAGRLRYDWITDATRRGYHVATYTDSADFIRHMAGHYRADLWRGTDVYLEVWCESRSIAGVIESDCRELAVSLYPAGGFSSLSLAYQSAEHIAAHAQRPDGTSKRVVILYIGDYDPAGVLIDQSIEREIRQHLGDDLDLTFARIAIQEAQIERYDLPTKPRKSGDRRAQHIRETVEAEAMPAYQLRELLRANIETHLPEHALAVAHVAEQSERDGLLRVAEILGGRAA